MKRSGTSGGSRQSPTPRTLTTVAPFQVVPSGGMVDSSGSSLETSVVPTSPQSPARNQSTPPKVDMSLVAQGDCQAVSSSSAPLDGTLPNLMQAQTRRSSGGAIPDNFDDRSTTFVQVNHQQQLQQNLQVAIESADPKIINEAWQAIAEARMQAEVIHQLASHEVQKLTDHIAQQQAQTQALQQQLEAIQKDALAREHQLQAQSEGVKAYAEEKYSSLQSEVNAAKAALAESNATANETDVNNTRLREEAHKL